MAKTTVAPNDKKCGEAYRDWWLKPGFDDITAKIEALGSDDMDEEGFDLESRLGQIAKRAFFAGYRAGSTNNG